jgi:hypothetical protein
LKLEYDVPPSNFAFNFNSRRYSQVVIPDKYKPENDTVIFMDDVVATKAGCLLRTNAPIEISGGLATS